MLASNSTGCSIAPYIVSSKTSKPSTWYWAAASTGCGRSMAILNISPLFLTIWLRPAIRLERCFGLKLVVSSLSYRWKKVLNAVKPSNILRWLSLLRDSSILTVSSCWRLTCESWEINILLYICISSSFDISRFIGTSGSGSVSMVEGWTILGFFFFFLLPCRTIGLPCFGCIYLSR